MPSARPRLQTLKPRLQELPPRIPTLKGKTLKEKQEANGRTLALNGAAWRKLRTHVLKGDPFCRECRDQGLLVLATDVDHQDNDPTNNSLENLVGLCKPHHSQKTAREQHGLAPAPMGCDTSGMPLDPNHPWNRGTVQPLLKKSPATERREPYPVPRAIAKSKKS